MVTLSFVWSVNQKGTATKGYIMPAPKGNQHAKKDNPKSASINIRVEPYLKGQAQGHAERIKITLSEYIERLLKQDLGL